MEQNNNNTKNRRWQQINEKTRYKIEAYLEEGMRASQIAKLLNYSVRTIQREIKLGLVKQRVKNTNYKKYKAEYIEIEVYRADVAQRKHNENASQKGRNLKIGNVYILRKQTLYEILQALKNIMIPMRLFSSAWATKMTKTIRDL